MAQTLLQLVDQAAAEMGVQAPATVISNTTLYVIQMLNLINGLGNDILRDYEWQGTDKLHTFSTVFYEYTGTTANGSTTISALSSTTGITTNPTYFTVSGIGINQNTTLVSVNAGAGTCVISEAATASGTVTITFSQTIYAMPSDFDRQVDRTHWDKSMKWELLGPTTAQQWEWLLSGYIATGPRIRYRILADKFQIWPPPAATDVLRFEYISTFWVATSAGTAPSKASFTIDTDTCIFNDSLMRAGLKMKWAQAKDMPQAQGYQREYMRLLDIAKAADGGAQTLSMAPRQGSILITWDNIPDSGYGT